MSRGRQRSAERIEAESGLEPGINVILAIAARGIRSRLTTSPKGGCMRTPSTYTDKPCGVPSNGEAVKPR